MSELKYLKEQRADLDRRISEIEQHDKAKHVAEIKARMSETGVTVADLGGVVAKPSDRASAPVAPKYRDAAGNTWSGRGFKPVWLRDALARGYALESFRIGAAA